MEKIEREEHVEYRLGWFWYILPRLKTFLKLALLIIIIGVSFKYGGSYFALGFLTLPVWLVYVKKVLKKQATPVIIADLEKNNLEVYEIQDLREWKVENPRFVGKILVADEIDEATRTIRCSPIRGLANLDFYIQRELFLKLKEAYPDLLKELAVYKYGVRLMAQEQATKLATAYILMEKGKLGVRDLDKLFMKPRLSKKVKLEGEGYAEPPEREGLTSKILTALRGS